MAVNGYGISCESDEIFYNWTVIMLTAQVCESTDLLNCIYKWVNLVVYELYLKLFLSPSIKEHKD